MSDIPALTSEAQRLSEKVDFWNWAIVVAMIVAAFAATVLVSFQAIAFKRAKQLADAEQKLSEAKETTLRLEAANVRAGAETDAKRIEIEGKKDIKRVETDAGKKIAEAQVEASQANQRTEELRQQNLEMEAAVAPRIMEQQQSAKELESFGGMNVIIESLAESEPWRTAGQIAFTLNQAKWNVQPGMKRYLDSTGFFDGVAVETTVGVRPAGDRSGDAADALVVVLKKNNIDAHRRPAVPEIPPNTLRLRIGLKPAGYFNRERKDRMYGNMLYR